MSNQKQQYYRHGDLLFVKVDSIPEEFKRYKKNPKSHSRGVIVAEGEKTGHHHTLEAVEQYYDFQWNGNRISFIEIQKETKIEHEEHGTIILPPGKYQINFQRELKHDRANVASTSSLIEQARSRVLD